MCQHLKRLGILSKLSNLLLEVGEVFDAKDDFAAFDGVGGGEHDEEGGASDLELLGKLDVLLDGLGGGGAGAIAFKLVHVQFELGGDGFVGGVAEFGLEGEEAIVVVPELALLLGGPGGTGGGFGLGVDVGEGEVFVDESEVGVLGDRLFNDGGGFGAVGALEVGEFDQDDVCVFGAFAGGGSEEFGGVVEDLG